MSIISSSPQVQLVIGPPGTGKTSYLKQKTTEAAQRFGSEGVLVASLTKAAAIEIASRNLPIDRGQVGTLHSHCYRALGCPEVAEAKIRQWNEEAPSPWRLSPLRTDPEYAEVELPSTTDGDRAYHRYQYLRNTMVPRDRWPPSIKNFARYWEQFKNKNGYVDFTDMIEIALDEQMKVPGNREACILDEAQDFSALERDLIRSWIPYTELVVLAADPEQSIYGFRGAIGDDFLKIAGPGPSTEVLNQSYRIRRCIHRYTEEWMGTYLNDWPRYGPRDAEGSVLTLPCSSWTNVAPVVDHALKQISDGRTVMLIASCRFMLRPLLAVLYK